MEGFDAYMGSLTPDNNTRNPWFREYWETFFGCHIDLAPNHDLACSPTRRITPQEGFQQDSKVGIFS